jgi:uncharacterized membrane protein YbhN (UPF0104 family)
VPAAGPLVRGSAASAALFLTVVGTGVAVWLAVRSGEHPSDLLFLLPLGSHALAFAAIVLSVFARGGRLSILVRASEPHVSLWSCVAAHLAGEAGGAVTPSRVGYEPARILALGRAGVRVSTGAATGAAELALDAAMVVLLAAALAWFLPGDVYFLAGAASYVLGVGALLGSGFLIGWAPAPARGILRALRLAGVGFRRELSGLRRAGGAAGAAAVALTAIHIGARLAVLPLLAVPLLGGGSTGGEATTAALVAVPFLLFYAGGAVPLPGGGGAVEIAYMALLAGQLDAGALAGTLVAWRIYTYYMPAAAGMAAFALTARRARTVRPAVARPDPNESGSPVSRFRFSSPLKPSFASSTRRHENPSVSAAVLSSNQGSGRTGVR